MTKKSGGTTIPVSWEQYADMVQIKATLSENEKKTIKWKDVIGFLLRLYKTQQGDVTNDDKSKEVPL